MGRSEGEGRQSADSAGAAGGSSRLDSILALAEAVSHNLVNAPVSRTKVLSSTAVGASSQSDDADFGAGGAELPSGGAQATMLNLEFDSFESMLLQETETKENPPIA
jgi:hypothetical protein